MRARELAPFRYSEETIDGERGSPVTLIPAAGTSSLRALGLSRTVFNVLLNSATINSRPL